MCKHGHSRFYGISGSQTETHPCGPQRPPVPQPLATTNPLCLCGCACPGHSHEGNHTARGLWCGHSRPKSTCAALRGGFSALHLHTTPAPGHTGCWSASARALPWGRAHASVHTGLQCPQALATDQKHPGGGRRVVLCTGHTICVPSDLFLRLPHTLIISPSWSVSVTLLVFCISSESAALSAPKCPHPLLLPAEPAVISW